ncbi:MULTISPECIES: hypothetical protein [Mycobacteroides]|nr:hypothetical protein [Mycobacteroides immunogenum]AMT72181.1 hypothetical protein ABG82_19670 [Mycobacteroides immunogenum]ANO05313.1 hypothetical protein BAB75_19925 [Mycobacteroides immunogenum]KIU37539.1 hypothetical protein TL11_27185 [Mycobacteroides immunogenum]KPG02283.1 hypothetical protein AN908_28200 [Mycobacteroides immunogenum]KPG02289.1 hypothetical protein AN909_27740 [Mycobacteroides immunogenum]
MGKWIAAGLLGLSGLSLLSEYPLWGVGLLGVAALLMWMGLQGRQAARVERSRPVAARQARMDVQVEVNAAQRAANKQVRRAVERARRQAQRNVDGAAARVRAEQAQRWVS